ncbi:unnamed protein product, partial [Cylicocyclus nassatus]
LEERILPIGAHFTDCWYFRTCCSIPDVLLGLSMLLSITGRVSFDSLAFTSAAVGRRRVKQPTEELEEDSREVLSLEESQFVD